MDFSGEYESMKSRETPDPPEEKVQVDEKRRRVAQIEGMNADFAAYVGRTRAREIPYRAGAPGNNDPTHFAYPTYAKAAIQGRKI